MIPLLKKGTGYFVATVSCYAQSSTDEDYAATRLDLTHRRSGRTSSTTLRCYAARYHATPRLGNVRY
eukprot:1783079-Rhodomonas_salina.1